MSGLGDLGATFQQNRTAILGTAVAGTVGFALYKKHTAKSATGPANTSTDGGVSVSAGGQLAGMNGANAYDSSASDVYGLVQPQLESLGSQISDLSTKLGQVPVAAPPTLSQPAPPPAPAAAPPPIPIASPAHAVDTWVTVNRGDSLSAIAARFPQQDITWQSIYGANRSTVGSNPNRIYAGQRLHVVG